MASPFSSSRPETIISEDQKLNLLREGRLHETAIAELTSLPSSRPVYQKKGNLYFRTTIEKATAFEQKQLDLSKSKLGKLSSV